MKNVIVVCEAGITTSLLVTKLKELAGAEDESYNISSKNTEEGLEYVKDEPVDAVLLVPQIHHKATEYSEASNGEILKISVRDYNNMNSYSIFEQLNEALA
ncbi:PTS sugar transporter subunit IIB [Alteribacillus sp. HJP-4]|uniref:PTS sugar transporter subunit IIB n=1 Tax=Alteribacillus sp. HJP-4 TaxID=2775394 RepID=UPI0035CCCC2E